MSLIDINFVLSKLKEKRTIFTSEADFQLELAWIIKTEYPHAEIRLEYCPTFNSNMHIDILVIINGKWIPIELKYKTKACIKTIDSQTYNLKTHGAKNINCYLYLNDIQRIEYVKSKSEAFVEGYAIFITNDFSYQKPPQRSTCSYASFSVHQNSTIEKGQKNWNENNLLKQQKYPSITLGNNYNISWNVFSEIDNTDTGTFWCLVNTIK